MKLEQTLMVLEKETHGASICLEDMVKALEKRGFGPLLIAPAILIILPTGAIPGVPALGALFILLVAGQLAIGARTPWIPKKLKQLSFSRTKFQKAIAKARPSLRQVDRFFHPRLEFLTKNIAQRIIACVCMALSVMIIVIGFIPFAPILPALSILLLGLSISAHDGLLALFGFIVAIATLFVPFLIN